MIKLLGKYQEGEDEVKLKDAKSKLSTINENTEKPWYNYSDKIWANIKTNNNGQEAWWVWVPRYAYKIQDTGTDNKHTDIIFIDTNNKPLDKKYGSELPEGYIVHPAFMPSGTDGSKNLKGIWISKFEASNNEK